MRYGANALAGLIVMRGARSGRRVRRRRPKHRSASTTANRVGAVATGPVDALNSAWRVAVQRYRSDGFRRDTYSWIATTPTIATSSRRARSGAGGRARTRRSTSPGCTRISTTATTAGRSTTRAARSPIEPGKDAQHVEWSVAACRDARRIARPTDRHRRAREFRQRVQLRRRLGQSRRAGRRSRMTTSIESLRERKTRSLEVRLASRDAPQRRRSLAWLVGAYALDLERATR